MSKQLLRHWEAVIEGLTGLPQLLESLTASSPATLQHQLVDRVNAVQARLQEPSVQDNRLSESVLQKLVTAQVCMQ